MARAVDTDKRSTRPPGQVAINNRILIANRDNLSVAMRVVESCSATRLDTWWHAFRADRQGHPGL